MMKLMDMTAMDGGNAQNASLHGRNLVEQRRSCCREAILGPIA